MTDPTSRTDVRAQAINLAEPRYRSAIATDNQFRKARQPDGTPRQPTAPAWRLILDLLEAEPEGEPK